MGETQQKEWEQTFNFLQHSGLEPSQVVRAILLFQSLHSDSYSLGFSRGELILLRTIINEIIDACDSGGLTAELTFKFNLVEATELVELKKKLKSRKLEKQ